MIAALLVTAALGQQAPGAFLPPPPVHVVAGHAPRVIAPRPGASHVHSATHGTAPDAPPGFFQHGGRGFILPPGPGDGWGFPNGAPDHYGWYGVGTSLPLGADRTPEYYFPRFLTTPPQTMFFPNYYNKYTTRGQRYLPYAGCGGGIHPASAPAIGLSTLPVTPYSDQAETGPVAPVPNFGGEVDASPTTPGETDLIP